MILVPLQSHGYAAVAKRCAFLARSYWLGAWRLKNLPLSGCQSRATATELPSHFGQNRTLKLRLIARILQRVHSLQSRLTLLFAQVSTEITHFHEMVKLDSTPVRAATHETALPMGKIT
jgi:hypothetical protein